jgi:hypothetical protein
MAPRIRPLFQIQACPCLSEASFVQGWTYAAEAMDGRERLGQALKKGPDSRKQAIV